MLSHVISSWPHFPFPQPDTASYKCRWICMIWTRQFLFYSLMLCSYRGITAGGSVAVGVGGVTAGQEELAQGGPGVCASVSVSVPPLCSCCGTPSPEASRGNWSWSCWSAAWKNSPSSDCEPQRTKTQREVTFRFFFLNQALRRKTFAFKIQTNHLMNILNFLGNY